MSIEIERKFLIPGKFPQGEKSYRIKQGYIDHKTCSIKISNSNITIIDKINRNFFIMLEIDNDLNPILNDLHHNGNGILILDDKNIARIRVRDNEAFITFKGPYTPVGTPEYEYPISKFYADNILNNFTVGHIDKIRHLIPFDGKTWEVDEFIYPVKMTLAEIELKEPGEEIMLPPWVGEEVTGDTRYFNHEIMKKGL